MEATRPNQLREMPAEERVNGIDVKRLRSAMERIDADAAAGMTRWNVTTRWMGGTRTDTRVEGYEIGGQRVEKDFTIRIDEPVELCGSNHHPNPQETLMAAMNACMTVGYATACAMHGVELEALWIETDGNIDLRGFLGLDRTVPAGYPEIRYTVHIKGKGTPEQFEKVHRLVSATSPNRYNLSHAIPLKSTLVVES